MIGSFRNNIPYNFFLLIIYAVLLKWSTFIHPVPPVSSASDPFLYQFLIGRHMTFFSHYPIVASIISFGLIVYQAVALNHLAYEQKLYAKPNYLSAMALVLFSSLFSTWHALSGTLIASTFMVWVLGRLCKMGHLPEAGKSLFNIGLISGIAALFYFSSIVFLLLVMLSLVISRAFKLSEWVLVFLGFITPYYLVLSLLYLNNYDLRQVLPDTGLSLPVVHLSQYEWSSIILVLVTSAVGFVLIQNNMRRLLVQSRKSWSITFIFLLIAVLIAFANKAPSFTNYYFIIPPMALVAAAAYHYPSRRWFPNLSHWGLVILSIIVGYFFITH